MTVQIRQLSTAPPPGSKPSSSACCIGRRKRTMPSRSAWPPSWPTCRRVAMRRCWSTRGASTGWPPRRWPRSRSRGPSCWPRWTPSRRPSGRRWKLRRAACAAITSASSMPAAARWSYRDEDGTLLGQKVTPLDRVGIYVPGGKAAYPSSVLMNAVPAKVAGVGEIVMVVPTPRARAQRHGAGRGGHCRRRPRLHASAARRPWPRSPTARPPCRPSTRSPDPATPMSPVPSDACSARSAST